MTAVDANPQSFERRGMLPEGENGDPIFDFSSPKGAEAICTPDSVSWRTAKNPIALSIGGVCAVLLEFADPRIMSGVFDHSVFVKNVVQRAKRTGMAHFVCIYGPRESARNLVNAITKMHGRVKGKTDDGVEYHAMDPELLNWVHATTAYGFPEAYHNFVSPLTDEELDRAYAEREELAHMFRAMNPPLNKAEFMEMYDGLIPKFKSTPQVKEYIRLSSANSPAPKPISYLQPMFVRAAIDILPPKAREILELGPEYDLKGWERRLLKFLGRRFDKKCIKAAPPAQACVRMGLPENYLYR